MKMWMIFGGATEGLVVLIVVVVVVVISKDKSNASFVLMLAMGHGDDVSDG